MKVLAVLAAIWIAFIAIGVAFNILGKLIWLGILLSIIVGLTNHVIFKDPDIKTGEEDLESDGDIGKP